MNSENGQKKAFDRRNLIFAVGGVAVILIFLAVVLENQPPKMQPAESVEHEAPVQKQEREALTQTPVIPKTTVNIQPLITRFPSLPDFNMYARADRRKAAFIDYLTPIIEYQNEKVLKDRTRLVNITRRIVNGDFITDRDLLWVQELADKYDVAWLDTHMDQVMVQLARRVDIIPVALAVVQAAKESSWGRSRYALEANNLFGQWCYDEGCGVVPGDRTPGSFHEVRRFPTVNDAARSYIHNLNTHPRYKNLRKIREGLRVQNKKITGSALANGLHYYSERRQAYVDEVKAMIEQYWVFQDRRTG